jgi:hypothetical protein
MKMNSLACVLAPLFILATVHAEASCRIAPNDPFEPSGEMPSGKFKGKCLDTGNQRSYRILTLEEAAKVVPAPALTNQLVWIANVNHQGKFWVGGFPKEDGIGDIVFQVEHFPPELVAAHTELRFNFKPQNKITLYPQMIGSTEPSTEISTVILSNEAIPMRTGPTYDLVKGTEGYYGLAIRMVSLEDKVQHIVFDMRDTTDQYRLKIEDSEINRFWDLAQAKDYDPKMQQMYDTLQHNCTNILFELIDSFQGHSRDTMDRATTALPIIAKEALNKRDFIEATLPTLNAEFHGPAKKKK